MRPLAGVIRRATELVQSRHSRSVCGRQAAHRHDHEAAGQGLPARRIAAATHRLHAPLAAAFVERGTDHLLTETYVASQIEAVGHMFEIAQDLGLRRVLLGPAPFLLQLRRKLVAVLDALDVAARTRVAVPVPGTADAAAGFKHTGAQPKFTQPMQHVESGEAGPHDNRVESDCAAGVCRAVRWR